MNYETLLFTVENNVATVTLNRPEVYNAANEKMTSEIQDVLKTIEKDSEIRAIILTGSGKAFCSGQDLKDTKGQLRQPPHSRVRDIARRRRAPLGSDR